MALRKHTVSIRLHSVSADTQHLGTHPGVGAKSLKSINTQTTSGCTYSPNKHLVFITETASSKRGNSPKLK